ncbi:MAG: hypothetical protein JXR96_09145 [Deltaproteobacteria bacterium]|nr:hypothetical protein [Deltaproteobacteria bacterium]
MKKIATISLSVLLSAGLLALAIGCGNGDGECTPGEKDCACKEDGSCNSGLTCQNNVCVEGSTECCPGQEGYIEVSGSVMDLELNPVAIDLTALSGLGVMTGTAVPLAQTTSDAVGTFTFECFDVSGAAMGLVLLADDAGTIYFPTVTGVAAYGDDPADKVCIEKTPPVWAVPTVLVTNLDNHPQIDSAEGLIIGFVVDAAGSPIEGATVTLADGTGIDPIFYPDENFGLDAISTTSIGMYIIPGPFNIQTLTAQATGETFRTDLYKAAAVDGYVYMVSIQAEE